LYIDDICNAFIFAADDIGKIKGAAINIGTGIKTTIRELANHIMHQYGIENAPEFGNMPNRNWDVQDWFSNSHKAEELIHWKYEINLPVGLEKVDLWQKEVNFDTAFWNWNK
jgi:polyisoprenyl-phosphate glycosyltransferase